MTMRDEIRQPRLSSKQKSDGSMISKPLEDLWPFLERQEFLSNMLIEPLEE
jgi:acetolactate synthase-1/2/3 large subunit